MIIDSHCHLDYPSLYENLEEVVKRAEFNKVNKLLTICTTLESFEKIKFIIEKYKIFTVLLAYILMNRRNIKTLIQNLF